MFIKDDYDFRDLQNACWDNAVDTLNTIEEHDMEDDFMDWFESYFGDEIPTITEINDILRFDDEWILEQLGIPDDEDEEEDDEDEAYETSDYNGDGWSFSNRGSESNNNDSGWSLDRR